MSKHINLKEHIPNYPSGIYLFKCGDGQTKFGVAKNFADRWQHREYTTRLIESVCTWNVPTDEMFLVESQIREKFKQFIREGARDYLMGDHFLDVKRYVDSILGKEMQDPIIPKAIPYYGLDAMVRLFDL